MSASKSSGKRRGQEVESLRSAKKQHDDSIDGDADLSSDLKGILSALQKIKEKAQKDGQKKNEETIGSIASEIRSMIDDIKSKSEKERLSFVKALIKSSKESENALKEEYTKFQADYERFSKEKALHLQAFKGIFSRYEEEKDKLHSRYDQQKKKEKTAFTELEKACLEKIAAAEESLKKKKQDDKSFTILRKTLGSFLDNGSDDDFGLDE